MGIGMELKSTFEALTRIKIFDFSFFHSCSLHSRCLSYGHGTGMSSMSRSQTHHARTEWHDADGFTGR